MKYILGPAFFVSGAAALILQTMWTRRLTTLFGNTIDAASLVLAVFFLGLAAGGALASWIIPHLRRPLVVYALCEAAVAAAVPIAWGIDAFRALPRFAVTLLVVGLPTLAMGATLPLLCEAVARRRLDPTWRPATRLYALNTAGAMIGTLLGGIVLPAAIGLRFTEITAMAALGAVAAVVGLAGLRLGPQASLEAARAASTARSLPTALAALSGFAFMSLEILWTRQFSLVFHNSVYTFAIVVAVVIGALAVGAALCNLLVDRFGPWRIIAGAAALAGVGIVAGSVAFMELTRLERFGPDLGFVRYCGAAAGFVAIVIGPATVAAGMIFPALWRLAGHADGRALGRLAAANTLGGVSGALASTFILLPGAGLWASLFAIATAYTAGAVLAALRFDAARRLAYSCAGLLLGASLFWCVPLLDAPAHEQATRGMSAWRIHPAAYSVQSIRPGEKLLKLCETSSGSVAVLEVPGDRRLVVDNLYTLGGTRALERQRREGFLPTLLHPDPENVAYIGVGTGISLSGALASKNVDRVVAIELLPDVLRAAQKEFAAFNAFALDDPRVQVVIADGRAHLMATDERFDVIISDLFVPWHAGAGHLFTREHFLSVRESLSEDGLFALWLPLWQLGARDFDVIAATFVGVFPQTEIWRATFNPAGPVVALVGWADRPRYTDETIGTRLAHLEDDAYFSDIESFGLLRAGTIDADDFAGVPHNTMNRPVIEFSAPKSERARDRMTGERWHVVVQRFIADDVIGEAWERRQRAGGQLQHSLVLLTHPTAPGPAAARAMLELSIDTADDADFLRDVMERGSDAIGP